MYVDILVLLHFFISSESSRRIVCLVFEYFQYRVLNTIRYMHFPIPQSPINATLFHTIGLDLQYDWLRRRRGVETPQCYFWFRFVRFKIHPFSILLSILNPLIVQNKGGAALACYGTAATIIIKRWIDNLLARLSHQLPCATPRNRRGHNYSKVRAQGKR